MKYLTEKQQKILNVLSNDDSGNTLIMVQRWIGTSNAISHFCNINPRKSILIIGFGQRRADAMAKRLDDKSRLSTKDPELVIIDDITEFDPDKLDIIMREYIGKCRIVGIGAFSSNRSFSPPPEYQLQMTIAKCRQYGFNITNQT